MLYGSPWNKGNCLLLNYLKSQHKKKKKIYFLLLAQMNLLIVMVDSADNKLKQTSLIILFLEDLTWMSSTILYFSCPQTFLYKIRLHRLLFFWRKVFNLCCEIHLCSKANLDEYVQRKQGYWLFKCTFVAFKDK